MFKKGAFELGATIIPVCIKAGTIAVFLPHGSHVWCAVPQILGRSVLEFAHRAILVLLSVAGFASDPLPTFPIGLKLMCFWGVHADVWYLEPEHQRPGESPIEFAARTRVCAACATQLHRQGFVYMQALIAEQGNLRTTNYDGYFKHFRPSPRFVEERQRRIAANYQRLFAAAPSGVTTAPASPLVGPCEQSPFAMGGTESTIPTPTTEPLPTPAPLPQLPPLAKTVAASGGGADVNTGRAGADEASGLLFVPPTRSTLCVAEELQRGEGALLRPRAVI